MFGLFKKKNPEIEKALTNCKIQADSLSRNTNLTLQGKYEAIMLGGFMTMMNPNFAIGLRKDLMRAIIKVSYNYNVNKTHNEVIDLLNERMPFYDAVTKEVKSGNPMALGSIYHVLIEEPLTNNPKRSKNLHEILKLQLVIKSFFYAF